MTNETDETPRWSYDNGVAHGEAHRAARQWAVSAPGRAILQVQWTAGWGVLTGHTSKEAAYAELSTYVTQATATRPSTAFVQLTSDAFARII